MSKLILPEEDSVQDSNINTYNSSRPDYTEDIGKVHNMKEHMRMALMGVCVSALAFVWWCMLYPELCFPKDVYEAVCEIEAEDADCLEEEIRNGLLQADEEQIIVKSRLLELLRQHKN